MEILKRFPVKTLARLTCVSTIRRQEFNKLWSSSNQQRRSSNTLIFAFKRDKGYGQDCFFFSSLQTKNPLEASVTATYLTAHPGDFSAPPSVHGLICYGPPSEIQPYHETVHYSPQVRFSEEVLVPLLGVRSHPHYSPESLHICIDGVLYYGACFGTGTTTSGVMSFDVRSEMFDVIRVPQGRARKFTCMTRYNGKLALIYTVYGKIGSWVLEDAVKHEWSSTFFDLPRLSGYNTKFQVFCAIDDGDDAGEFVLAPKELQESTFYVLYYDPKKKRVRKVDVEGITEHEELPLWDKDWKLRTMSIFPGQVEILMFL